LLSAGMWKRRVGVTAWLRQIGRSRVTGSAQIATEMAAPFELRTPTGTAANRLHQSANGSMATMALKSTGRGRQSAKPKNRTTEASGREPEGTARREARMRRCLKLRQGASPLRPPAPFPWTLHCTERREFVKGSLSRRRAPPLTNSPRSEDFPMKRERGPLCTGPWRSLPLVGLHQYFLGRAVARCARMRRCLILRQGDKPPETPEGT
jgi:hypothetical protein